ncbi:putative snornp assembly factor naf1 [Erysiphe neolycopersici]|uniref:H/ACA ribonucleoprotein complex non-core subunit NAF1 n=1 Tax=Erysiphe neolycopersici TaxID=212602 RepID=A0A420HAR8_9PEZI|nr:putative snornp assembly factor naf1 [Erysiphe neolycopersici]
MNNTTTGNPVIPGLFLCDINNVNNNPASLENLPHNSSKPQDIKSRSWVSDDGIQESNNATNVENDVNTESSTLPQELNVTPDEEENMEWEADSLPIEDSSNEEDSSENDSSSDDSDAEDDTFKLLSPEEQARILMLGDGGSDDEGGDKSKGPEGQLRTKNEILEEVITKPDVIITQDMPITELGAVEQVVGNIILIKAKISGEYKVLESGSILCLSDRSVIGVVAETIGRVQQPFYSVLFTNAAEILAAGLSVGTIVFFSELHSTFVFTKNLKAIKGSDASNINDEEVGEDEVEFSDDEAEAEHRRKIKQKRQEKRGVKPGTNGSLKRSSRSFQKVKEQPDFPNSISYDENEDEPYKTLTRPVGYTGNISRNEGSSEQTNAFEKDKTSSGEKNKSHGRANRYKSNMNSGRGRGFHNRRGNRAPAPTYSSHQPGNDSSTVNATHPNPVSGLYNNFILPNTLPNTLPNILPNTMPNTLPNTQANTLPNTYPIPQNSLNMQQPQEYDPRHVQAQQWPNPFLMYYGINPFNG